MTLRIPRRQYADLYGPTDRRSRPARRHRPVVEVEHDLTVPGDEVKFGGGKVIRDGMGQSAARHARRRRPRPRHHERRSSSTTGHRQGRHRHPRRPHRRRRQGRQPRHHGRRHPGLVVGAGTEVIAGEGLIVTAGGIDTHIHFICPQQVDEALSRRAHHDARRRHRPRHRHERHDLHARAPGTSTGCWRPPKAFPVNSGFLGKGNASPARAAARADRGGRLGLKLHEDWGTTPAAIDCALRVADEHDVQVAIHTDTLNEAGFVEDTIRAITGRTIHTYHTEGAGGGHAPDIMQHLRRAELPALLHQPDAAVHRQHARRAPRHAHGLPPPEPEDPRGRRLRRVAHPGRDDRGRGRAPRPRAPSA